MRQAPHGLERRHNICSGSTLNAYGASTWPQAEYQRKPGPDLRAPLSSQAKHELLGGTHTSRFQTRRLSPD